MTAQMAKGVEHIRSLSEISETSWMKLARQVSEISETSWVKQMAKGVEHIHSRRMLHRYLLNTIFTQLVFAHPLQPDAA